MFSLVTGQTAGTKSLENKTFISKVSAELVDARAPASENRSLKAFCRADWPFGTGPHQPGARGERRAGRRPAGDRKSQGTARTGGPNPTLEIENVAASRQELYFKRPAGR